MRKVERSYVCVVRCSSERMRERAAPPWIILAALLMCAGCFAVGPDYKTPDIVPPVEWSRDLRGGLNAAEPEAETLAEWWTTLRDTELSNLVERAIAGNPDLKKAQARIREARARRGVAEAGLFPTLNLGGSATVGRSSEDTGSGQRRELYRTCFYASRESDVFGCVRRSSEAAPECPERDGAWTKDAIG